MHDCHFGYITKLDAAAAAAAAPFRQKAK